MAWDLFDRCGEAAARLIESDEVAAAWTMPSPLPGYTMAGLAGHLSRAVSTVERYLAAPLEAQHDLIDAAGYFVAVLGAHDPRDSDLHRAIRRRGADAATVGPHGLAREIRATLARVRERRTDVSTDAAVEVLDGLTMPIDEYLRTRLVELVVHIDDLSVGVDQDARPDLPDEAYHLAACVLAEVAARRVGGLEVVRSLARRERHPDAVRAL